MNSFFVLRSGRNGARSPARADVLADNWFASPKKDRKSVRLEGVGNIDIAVVIELSIWYPSADMVNPAKLTFV